MSVGPRRIYYNVAARASRTDVERDGDPPAVIVDDRAAPLLPRARGYSMAFARLDLSNCSNLSAYEPTIAADAANTSSTPNQTVYHVGVQMSAVASQNPAFPFAVVAGGESLRVRGFDALGQLIDDVTVAVALGAVANIGALAAAVQAAIAASPSFAAVTVAAGVYARRALTPAATMRLWIVPTTQLADVAFGGQAIGTAIGVAALALNRAAIVGKVTSPLFTASVPCWWSPEDLSAPTPATPIVGVQQDWGAPFYAAYNLSTAAAMYQAAFAWCLDDAASPYNATPGTTTLASIAGQYTAWAAGLGLTQRLTTRPPEVTYNAAAARFELAVDAYSSGRGAVPPTSSLLWCPSPAESATYMCDVNSAYNALNGFPLVWQTRAVAAGTSFDARIAVERGAASTLSDGSAAVVVTQESSNLAGLSNVETIVLVSTSLPVVCEAQGNVGAFTLAGDPVLAAASDEELPIVTDLSVGSDPLAIASGQISYLPTFYRWASLTDNESAVRGVRLQAFWRHARSGALFPVRLGPGGAFSAKLVFERL